MPVKDCQTKQLIIEAAMRIFFCEGKLNATTQEIADVAGVNRTLINYYFRSKKALFDYVVKKAMREFMNKSDSILSSDLPLREKTEKFIDGVLDKLSKYPYLESYMTMDLIQKRLKKNDTCMSDKGQPTPVKQYLEEIEKEMKKGNIPATKPVHFMINMTSLMIYPQIMKPLQMKLIGVDEPEYQKILDERKQVILNILFPQRSLVTNL